MFTKNRNERQPFRLSVPRALVALSLVFGAVSSSADVAQGFWAGVGRSLATSPNGNVAAVSCHNCYDWSQKTTALSESQTMARINSAIQAGADLIELDLFFKDGQWVIAHAKSDVCYTANSCATLSSIVSSSNVHAGNQILYLELKNPVSDGLTARDFSDLLDILNDADLVRSARPAVIRTNQRHRQNLVDLRDVLAGGSYSRIRKDVYLSELFWDTSVETTDILKAKTDGFHSVEFNRDKINLQRNIAYAKALGLGVNIGTFANDWRSEVYIAAYRDLVDVLTVDLDIATTRAIVEAKNSLLHLDVTQQSGVGGLVRFTNQYGKMDSRQSRGAVSWPSFVLGGGSSEKYFGGALKFSPASQEYVKFYDADNIASKGLLIAAVVNFDEIEIADGDTAAIVSKTDGAGAALELHNPSGSATTVLRYSVNVGGAYHSADYPMSNLNAADTYLIVAGYDGDGSARLFVNHREAGQSGSLTGGITLNNSPWLIGADPQGSDDQRFFFNGKVQMVSVQRWPIR